VGVRADVCDPADRAQLPWLPATPPPAAPTTAVVGAGTPIPSVDAPRAPAMAGARLFVSQPPTPSSTTTPRPSATPAPSSARTRPPVARPPGTPPPASGGARVRISNFAFAPLTITVSTGRRERRQTGNQVFSTLSASTTAPSGATRSQAGGSLSALVHDHGNLRVPRQHPPRYDRHRHRHRVGTPRPTLHRRTRP
jgi:hypothetical protein